MHCHKDNQRCRPYDYIDAAIPPYTPDLQAIELFWGIGNDYATEKNTNTSCLQDVVSSLRNSWYGNNYVFNDNIEHIDISSGLLRLGNNIRQQKQPVDCRLLFNHMIDLATIRIINDQ
jgi:hypothetical protein